MTAEIRVTLDDDSRRRADDILGQLAEKASNVEGGLRNVGEALLRTTGERFDTETDPAGQPWAPLQLTTIMQRGCSGHILTVSGRLRRSISYEVSGATLRLGPNTVDAAAHQFGSTHEIRAKNAKALSVPIIGPRGFTRIPLKAVIVTIPARPYIGFGRKDEEAAREAVEEWLEVEPAN